MPKLAPTPFQASASVVQANIRSRGAWFGCCNDVQIAKKIGMSNSTYHYRKVNPTSWTLEELIKISILFKCSLEWLVADHSEV